MRLPVIAIFSLLTCAAFSQFRVSIAVTVPPGSGDVYLMGDFNSWNPVDERYRLTPVKPPLYNLEATLPAGPSRLCFVNNHGTAREADRSGTQSVNRFLMVSKDTSMQLKVQGWFNPLADLKGLSDSALYHALMNRAGFYLDRSLDSSFKYSVQLYDAALKTGSRFNQARALDLQGFILEKSGNGDKALPLFFRSLKLKKEMGDSSGVSFVYNRMGDVYASQGNDKLARESFEQAFLWAQNRFERISAKPLISIAAQMMKHGQLDSALAYTHKALRYNPDFDGALWMMGNIEKEKKNFPAARSYYRKMMDVTPGNLSVSANCFRNIADAFLQEGRPDSALHYAQRAYTLAAMVKDPGLLMDCSSLLSTVFEKTKRWDSAYAYQKKVQVIKDTLNAQEKAKDVYAVYFNDRLQQQELQAQKDRYRASLKMYWLAGLCLLLVVAIVAYRIYIRSKFQRQLSALELQALRARMNPHFIFNCLNSINKYIIKNDAKAASGYLTKFAKLIRLILDSAFGDDVSLRAEIETLKLYMEMEALRFRQAFTYHIDDGNLTRAEGIAIPAMLIQPYIENAIWHGLVNKEEQGELWLRFRLLTDHLLQVEVEDNGIGRAAAKALQHDSELKTKSYGMQITQDRLRIINGRHELVMPVAIEDLVDSNGRAAGTKVTLKIPVRTIRTIETKQMATT